MVTCSCLKAGAEGDNPVQNFMFGLAMMIRSVLCLSFLRSSGLALMVLLSGAGNTAFAQDQTSPSTQSEIQYPSSAARSEPLSAPQSVGLPLLSPEDVENWTHATALIGSPRYGDGFEHFDYVNPNAPKGGQVRIGDIGSFDSLNFVPPRGEVPAGLGLIYDTLMVPSLDEISAMYGLLAEALYYPDDYSYVIYRLRPQAKWHDGQPVTPEDVVWSFQTLKEHNPQQAFYYAHVKEAFVSGEREITFTFDETGNRELPHIVGQLMIMPKHWWTGTDSQGNQRDITRGTLEPPLSSGPYEISEVIPGRSITYKRVDDYWGLGLPVVVGHHNFSSIRYDYYRDDAVALEAFKAGDLDWRVENTARNWANAYQIPPVEQGDILLETFEEPYRTSGIMSGFVFNLRKDLFQDRAIRQAFNYALDFSSLNKDQFFGQYERINSYFYGIELASRRLPDGREREILEEMRANYPDDVPVEVLTQEYRNPETKTRGDRRNNLQMAIDLFEKGGWTLSEEPANEPNENGFLNNMLGSLGLQNTPERKVMRDSHGNPVSIEILLNGPTLERVALFYEAALESLGIEVTIRVVDSSQYLNRLREGEFDIVFTGWAQSMSPGNEQKEFFGSAAADRPGSRNVGGIQNPAVDALIDRIIFAKDREELKAAVAAMDRVLLWNHYLVPGWTLRAARIARWDRYEHPQPLPTYGLGFPDIWWAKEATE
jgi:microcin C transport system substrate-binding protein